MQKFYTAESVTQGHPDKLCDLIADSILDACLEHDPEARVACEVMATAGNIIISGEITAAYLPNVRTIALNVLSKVGYDPHKYNILSFIHPQSPNIANAVNVPLDGEYLDGYQLGAGDQGVVIGYACDETEESMPMPVILAHRITNLLTIARLENWVPGIGPDGKAQVTVEYEDHTPLRVDTVLVSIQHSPDKPYDELVEQITEMVLGPALKGYPVDDNLTLIINPSGEFTIGGPEADTGLTGRKLMVDSYGVFAPHGGGAYSGKDPSKVDRSGAYMARCIAKNLVECGFASRCQVSIAYAIGMAEPVMVEVDTFHTCPYCEDDCLADAVRQVFDLTPAGIIQQLDLQRPIYADTAVGGHFGREQFPWEQVDKISELLSTVI